MTHIQQVLDVLNALRANHGSPPVEHDSEMSAMSQEWADGLLTKKSLQHDPVLSFYGYGENIAIVGSNKKDDIEIRKTKAVLAAIEMWYNEEKEYNYNNGRFTPETGHFTALVWRETDTVGWGVSFDDIANMAYVVQRYMPAGNVAGKFARNVSRPQAPAPAPTPAPNPEPVVAPAAVNIPTRRRPLRQGRRQSGRRQGVIASRQCA